MSPELLEQATKLVEEAQGPERFLLAVGLGVFAVIWIADRLGLFDRLRRKNGSGKSSDCPIEGDRGIQHSLAKIELHTKQSVELQTKIVDLAQDAKTDHKVMLARMGQEPTG